MIRAVRLGPEGVLLCVLEQDSRIRSIESERAGKEGFGHKSVSVHIRT